MRKFTIMLALMSFIGLQAVLAQRTITGTVTGAADGNAIPGVSVVVQGTTTGTTTDLDGNYNLTVNDNAKALEFSFVGMIKKVIPIGASNVMNVVLESEMMDIEGVVVTALGISR
ncbi:MAG: carboxypeptidase-like regulatory domain-containing protein, partial [Bacteroidota bacterium]|nr:carboxypeptidase-like regulatory domain-containing protein [Bacteroidota bacterium]